MHILLSDVSDEYAFAVVLRNSSAKFAPYMKKHNKSDEYQTEHENSLRSAAWYNSLWEQTWRITHATMPYFENNYDHRHSLHKHFEARCVLGVELQHTVVVCRSKGGIGGLFFVACSPSPLQQTCFYSWRKTIFNYSIPCLTCEVGSSCRLGLCSPACRQISLDWCWPATTAGKLTRYLKIKL